jgi:aspartyl-tRNA synthetase
MTLRTDYCGELRETDADRVVTLCGWIARVREHGEHLAFLDLRDRTGIVQCVVDGAHALRSEFVVMVSGTVRRRPEGAENPALPTGAVEVYDCKVEVLSEAGPPPFPISDRASADEQLRFRYRYLDLRRERPQRNLMLRARIIAALRASMERHRFVEVETPLLWSTTPEGAREFLVPARRTPGTFYALPQSPQLAKQLLMVAGLDRYYQIARCARDEDLRADRQFEFTQLDLEASFADTEDVIGFVSEAVSDATEAATGRRPDEMVRISWHEAMDRYGTDKPDVRLGMELVELTGIFGATRFQAFQAPAVKGVNVRGGGETTRRTLDDLTGRARQLGAKGLAWMKVAAAGELASPVAKHLGEEERRQLVAALDAEPGDLLLVVADERPVVQRVLGALRSQLGRPRADGPRHAFVWVVDFPLFEGIDDTGHPVPAHHPFTMPHPDDLDLIERDPLKVRSLAYDLVLNDWELGSGSVRIHRPAVQRRIFEALGLPDETIARRFGFLLEAFRHGVPPHAGFGLGVDRLVAKLTGEDNVREVIAFPKSQSGQDPMTGAPTPGDPRQLGELGLLLSGPRPGQEQA